jgi:uncharacterized protein
MAKDIQIRHVIDEDRVFIDMPDHADNPCTRCGACCAYFRVSFYCGELGGENGGMVPVELTSKVNDFIACMQGTEAGHGRCVALTGTLGQPGIGCSIYANRPSPCREFPVWMPDGSPNPECQRLRAIFGIPPLQAADKAG